MKDSILGNGAAILAIIIWGSAPAIIITQYNYLKPMDLVLTECLIAYILICFVHRKPIKPKKKIHELYFFLIGLLGSTATVGLENVAYLFVTSGTVSVIYSTSPLIVVIIYMVMRRRAYVGYKYWVGGVIALLGCAIVSTAGAAQKASFIGILLAVIAAGTWAVYNVLYDYLQKEGDYPIYGVLRRMFFYGFLSTLVILLLTGSNLSVDVILHGHNVLVLLIAQGVFMGAIAYLLWNWSCEKIGPAKTSIYVYGMPFVTLIVSAVVISEELTALKLVGCLITVVGVFLSQLDKGISQCKL